MSVVIKSFGSFKELESYLNKLRTLDIESILRSYAREGVNALSRATPIDSGLAENSWSYEVEVKNNVYTIWWTNTDVENGFPVVIMLQYGHGTGTGGYVQGRDFINPAMRPVFDDIANKVWKAVTSA